MMTRNPSDSTASSERSVENGHESAEQIKKAVLGTIRKFTRNRPPEDDQTMVVISFDEPAPAMLRAPALAAVVSESVN
jgi:hypothetical protein